jgi:transcriptional regulator with XRE-family HTH domain
MKFQQINIKITTLAKNLRTTMNSEPLTPKQIKTRWIDIKKQINARQLLAYRVSIPVEKWDEYMHSTPSEDEINRIYDAIQQDRINKTARVKEALSKIVGYRESVVYSKKIGISNSYIREILEGKKLKAGYEIIDKIELFLNTILPDFEMSIENPLTLKNFTQDYANTITNEINKVVENLKDYRFNLSQMITKRETATDWRGNKISATRSIEYSIERLTEIKEEIDLFWNIYIEKQNKIN